MILLCYSCVCPPYHKGFLCDVCTVEAYKTSTGCQPCNCSVGAKDISCSSSGQCTCDADGGGTKARLADNKCVCITL